jgi:hypothetical protein
VCQPRGGSWRHRLPGRRSALLCRAPRRACLSCSSGRPRQVNSHSIFISNSSTRLLLLDRSAALLPAVSSSHATIPAAPLHGHLRRRAIPAAAAGADDRRPLGVAAQARAGFLHGHGQRRLAREGAAAGRGRRRAHLAASPQHVSYSYIL